MYRKLLFSIHVLMIYIVNATFLYISGVNVSLFQLSELPLANEDELESRPVVTYSLH